MDLLVRHFQLIGDNPYLGRRRDELRSGYRSFPVGEYPIFYRVSEPGVRIVLRRSREVTRLLSKTDPAVSFPIHFTEQVQHFFASSVQICNRTNVVHVPDANPKDK